MLLLCDECKSVEEYDDMNVIIEKRFGNTYSSLCVCEKCMLKKDNNDYYLLENAFPVKLSLTK